MKILSWNVNGLRAADRKIGFVDYLERCGAWLIGLQEVRADRAQLPAPLLEPPGWHAAFSPAERRGYSGVGLYCRTAPDSVETSLGAPEWDSEGRVQLAVWGRLLVANVYFPNGSGKERDNGRVPFKLGFYRALFARLDDYRRRGFRVLVMGDFNTAHTAIDLARPKQNEKTSGFLPEEREELDRWIQGGFVDTFRHFQQAPGHYSWWSQRLGARARNVGWRIDYVLASAATMAFVQEAFILPEQLGSDHCPVGIEIDAAVCEPTKGTAG